MAKQCSRCRQFRGRGFHRCPGSTVAPAAAVKGVGGLSDGAGVSGRVAASPLSSGSYGDAYAKFRSTASPTDFAAVPERVEVERRRDHLRFGRQYEYHGHVAVALERAHRALSTGVDGPGGRIDEAGVNAAVWEAADRVHRHAPEGPEGAVYAPQTRSLATRVVNLRKVVNGRYEPDFTVPGEDGQPRYVRPEVAHFLSAVRDDLVGHEGLRAAARAEAQRAVAKAALAAQLH